MSNPGRILNLDIVVSRGSEIPVNKPIDETVQNPVDRTLMLKDDQARKG